MTRPFWKLLRIRAPAHSESCRFGAAGSSCRRLPSAFWVAVTLLAPGVLLFSSCGAGAPVRYVSHLDLSRPSQPLAETVTVLRCQDWSELLGLPWARSDSTLEVLESGLEIDGLKQPIEGWTLEIPTHLEPTWDRFRWTRPLRGWIQDSVTEDLVTSALFAAVEQDTTSNFYSSDPDSITKRFGPASTTDYVVMSRCDHLWASPNNMALMYKCEAGVNVSLILADARTGRILAHTRSEEVRRNGPKSKNGTRCGQYAMDLLAQFVATFVNEIGAALQVVP